MCRFDSSVFPDPSVFPDASVFPEKEMILESELTDEQYQEIGFNLMARLGAIYKTNKNKP